MSYLYKIIRKNIFYLLTDLLIINTSYVLSYILRFFPALKPNLFLLTWQHLVVLSSSYILSFYIFQIYRIMWEYSNIPDIYRLSFANVSGFLGFTFIGTFFHMEYSRMIYILVFFLILVMSIVYRVLIRDYFLNKQNDKNQKSNDELNNKNNIKNLLLVGATEAGRTILSEYSKIGLSKNIVGFVDDDKSKIGKMFNGKMIFDATDNVTDVISKYDVDEVIMSMPFAESAKINSIVLSIKKEFKNIKRIKIKTLPPLLEVLDKKSLITSLREVNINDLIGREEVKVDSGAIEKHFSNKVILITGAGGSIGSEMCKQLLKFKIKRLITVGRGEYSIYNLIKMLNEYISYLDDKPEIIVKIADIKDIDLLDTIFKEQKPDIVFHTAAHKHVPLMEFNETEAINNNVIGTLNTLKLSKKYKIEEFVLISTDKAVNPVSIMGATKRIAEYFIMYYNKVKGLKTTIVRFGNVIDSRGSVIPLFKEQIENGGPVTITHPKIKRYFMTIPEASILVINASAYAQGGDILVLDMGKQYKIIDIAKNLIKFYGYEPDKDIKIVFTGLRPGEKLYEELWYDEEVLRKTKHEKIFVLSTNKDFYDKETIDDFIKNDLVNFLQYDSRKIRSMIKKVVKDYNFREYDEYMCDISKFIS